MDRREVAKDVNANILELAERFDRAEERFVTFLCECGCFQFVELRLKDYRARGGAVIRGHSVGGNPED